MKKTPLLFILGFTASLWCACNPSSVSNNDTPPVVSPNETNEAALEKEIAAGFNADSAYYFIAKQVGFGPRVPGTASHRKCGDYLVQTLKNMGPTPPEVQEQFSTARTFDNKTIPVRNIISQFYPERARRILLAAHWDTRPFAETDPHKPHLPIEGANDGASGVGVLMEIARQLALHDPGIGVDIIFFDAEDWGDTSGQVEDSYCLGSQYWAKNPHVPNYTADYGILLDMVGDKNALFAIEDFSWRMAQPVVQKIWNKAQSLGYGNLFINQKRGPIIDDHYYVMLHRQFPMVDIINFDPNSYSRFGRTWHNHNDNLENISTATLLAVGKTVIHILFTEKKT
jgi:hypothetical protein